MKRHMLFLILSSLIIICSCQEKQSDIFEYLEKRHQSPIADATTCLLILSDKGCANCNVVFKDFVHQNINNNKVQVILTAKGKLFDISYFKNSKTLIDQNISATTYAELDRSQAIFIKENKIDTVVIIEANSIEDQISYLSKRIK